MPKAIDESTDAYDSIAWLLDHIRDHNGRVGMMGVSYDGWLTAMAMLDPHPALREPCRRRPRRRTCVWATTSITTARSG